MIADVTDEEVSRTVELNAVRLPEARRARRTAVTRVAGLSVAGDRGDDSGLQRDLAHRVVRHVDDVQISRRVEANLVRQVEGGQAGGTTIAAEAFRPGPGHRRDRAVARDAADALAGVLAEPERAVGTPHHAERIVESREARRPAVAGEAFFAGTGHGLDDPSSRSPRRRQAERGQQQERKRTGR